MPLFLRRLGVACAIAIAPLLAHCGDDGRGDDDDDVAVDDDDDDVPALVSIALEPATLLADASSQLAEALPELTFGQVGFVEQDPYPERIFPGRIDTARAHRRRHDRDP